MLVELMENTFLIMGNRLQEDIIWDSVIQARSEMINYKTRIQVSHYSMMGWTGDTVSHYSIKVGAG